MGWFGSAPSRPFAPYFPFKVEFGFPNVAFRDSYKFQMYTHDYLDWIPTFKYFTNLEKVMVTKFTLHFCKFINYKRDTFPTNLITIYSQVLFLMLKRIY